MAYINSSEAKEIRKEIKKQFPTNEGWKFSIVVRHHSSLDITILTAPFDMESEDNADKAREIKDQLDTQEGMLNDHIPEQRELGINAGLAWLDVADKHVFYVDLGMSDGMLAAEQIAIKNKIPVEYRRILNNDDTRTSN